VAVAAPSPGSPISMTIIPSAETVDQARSRLRSRSRIVSTMAHTLVSAPTPTRVTCQSTSSPKAGWRRASR
jgi:hypothetical protein